MSELSVTGLLPALLIFRTCYLLSLDLQYEITLNIFIQITRIH